MNLPIYLIDNIDPVLTIGMGIPLGPALLSSYVTFSSIDALLKSRIGKVALADPGVPIVLGLTESWAVDALAKALADSLAG